jgi:hypothetical protein
VHRFLLSGVDSEFASDGGESDRFFGSSNFYFVGTVLAPRFFSQRLAQNFSQQFTSLTASRVSSNRDRRGSVCMQLTEALEQVLAKFLNFKQTSVDDGSQRPATYNSAEEMEQAFSEWLGKLVEEFICDQDWEEIFRTSGEEYEA